MTTKIITIFKYIPIALIVISGLTACETNFENVGGDLVDNGVFNTKKANYEVIAHSKNTNASRVDNISTAALSSLKMPLGVYKNDDFGLFESSVIAQVNPPASLDWEENSILDAVYLEIPYDAKRDGVYDNNEPKFKLNNIYGDQEVSYQIKVSKLDTYLSRLNPIDPSKANKYYSDEVYNIGEQLALVNDFKPNANDTIRLFSRTLIDTGNIQMQDTIKKADLKPFIRIPLDKAFFETNFIDNDNQSVFENNNDFHAFFNGIVIEAQGSDGSVMLLDFATAKINMYLSIEETEEKTEIQVNTDLNTDGYIGEVVPEDGLDKIKYSVRKKKVIGFFLNGIKTNHFERDYSSANCENQINNPNTIDGEEKLFVHGAAGSIAVIDLFNGIDLDEIRAKNWLINEANLTFNIDNQNDNDVPNRLLLYKLDSDETNDINENYQVVDAIKESIIFNGFLQKDEDTPTKYKVNITEYISEILQKEDFTNPDKLGLKVFNGLDTPQTVNDTIVKEYSWNPQGVVLYGNKYVETNADYDKRVKLEIYYTELNN